MQYTICNMQYTICNIQYTICNMQYTICNIQHAICNIQYVICNIQYAIYNMQYAISFYIISKRTEEESSILYCFRGKCKQSLYCFGRSLFIFLSKIAVHFYINKIFEIPWLTPWNLNCIKLVVIYPNEIWYCIMREGYPNLEFSLVLNIWIIYFIRYLFKFILQCAYIFLLSMHFLSLVYICTNSKLLYFEPQAFNFSIFFKTFF